MKEEQAVAFTIGYNGPTSESHHRGMKRELRFWIVFTKYYKYTLRDAPEWFRGIRKAKKHEDAKGADYFMITDVGEIPIDVKSSPIGVSNSFGKTYNSKTRKVIIAVGHPTLDHAQCVRIRTFEAAAIQRARMVRN